MIVRYGQIILMLQCPQCRARLPLRPFLEGKVLFCSRCGSTLKPRRGTQLIPLIVATMVMLWTNGRLKSWGFRGLGGVLAGLAVAAVVWFPLYVLTVRYRRETTLFP